MRRVGRGILWRFSSLNEKERRFSVSLVGEQVDLEMRPRSILEEKKDTGLN